MSEFVYLGIIKLKGKKILKIGRSWNVRIRARQHANKKGVKFTVLNYFALPDLNAAIESEKELLLFARSMYGGKTEWFPYDEAIIDNFESTKRGCNGKKVL